MPITPHPTTAGPAAAAARSRGTGPDLPRRAGLRAGLALLGAAGLSACALPGGGASATAAGPAPVWRHVPIPPAAPATEGTVVVPGGQIWFQDSGGSGEAVVFCHAASQSGAGWGYQQPDFVAAGWRVITWSRRGYRGSSPSDPAQPGHAADDLAAVLDARGVTRAHLVAVAHGAFFAIDFALQYPQRTRSLTIASSFLGVDDGETAYREANQRLRPKAFDALPPEFKELHPSYRAGNPEGLALWRQFNKEATNSPRVNPRRHHVLTWQRFGTLRPPVLLMTGDGDLYTPPALLRMQAAALPSAETAVITEAGHNPHWEQPQAFNARVMAFLRRHAGR